MKRKTFISAIGVIVLGTLGSGLWELIKPLLGWGWSALLFVATLGLDSLRNGIYADASKAFSMPLGLLVAIQVTTSLISLTGAIIIRSLRTSAQSYANLYFYMLFIFTIAMFISTSRTAYISQLATYYLKLETIAAPHLSEIELKRLRASYVQVNTRSAYIAHVITLKTIIESADEKAPTRDFF